MPINIGGNQYRPRIVGGSVCNVYEYDGSNWNLLYDGGQTLDLNTDNNADSTSNETGITFTARTDMDAVQATLSSNVGSSAAWPANALVKEGADGTVLETIDISGMTNGDVVEFAPSGGFTGGDSYTINLENGGSTYGRGRYEESSQYPHTSNELEVVQGVYSAGGSTTQNVRYNWSDITPVWK